MFLDDEVRFYFAATNVRHARRWELLPQRAGLGVATSRPDRFVALEAGEEPGTVATTAFVPAGMELRLNARTESDGWVRAELCDERGLARAGRAAADCIPFSGDALGHVMRWRAGAGGGAVGLPDAGVRVSVRLQARRARLYSVSLAAEGERARCDRFTSP